MGKHLDKLRRLDKIASKFQDTIKKLFIVAKEGVKHPDKELSTFAFLYAYLNYNFAIYLLQRFPKAIEADKIDKQFGTIMKDFNRRNGKKRRK